MNKNKVKIIGPFLGPHGETGVEVFIALPHKSEIEKIECQILYEDKKIDSKESQVKNELYRLFSFKFENLEDNRLYKYKFLSNGQSLDLEGGLTEEDCRFQILGKNDIEKSFILMSCHNPFKQKNGSAGEGWEMWRKLSEHLKKDKNVRLLVLGGDQIYNDDIEKEFINKLKQEDADGEIKKSLQERFIEQYQKYWGNISYRKVLASTLSVTMWDDHDITDGWGSRLESFNSKEESGFKKNWWKFFETAKESFKIYQASRNPKPIHKFSSILNWGDMKFVLADFRSERNSSKNQIWTEEHKNKILDNLKQTPDHIKKIFFVSPVVAFRTNFLGDKRISELFRFIFKLKTDVEKNKPWYVIQKWKLWLPISALCFLSPLLVSILNCSLCGKIPIPIFSILYFIFVILLPIIGSIILILIILSYIPKGIAAIPELPELSDDMEDGLSSDSNRKSLNEIMEVLTELARKGKEIFILSGDIHAGGLTEIVDTRKGSALQMLQIVSSPISYSPMPKSVLGLTTTTSEMELRNCNDEKKLFARNIFYISKRNFAQIFPDQEEKAISFYLEGHQFPISFPKRFLK